MGKIRVTYYQRKSRRYNNFSLENYFESVRAGLPEKIVPTIRISKFQSNGFFKRIYNTIEAIFRQGDINHITGDVHYLNYFLKRKRNVLTVLDCGQLKILKGIKFKLFRFFWFRLPASKSNYITTISSATKKDLLNYIKFDADKIKIIPVCISSGFTKNYKKFNSVKPRILQVGVTINKNLERLLLALENIPCTLVIIGDIPKNIKLLAQQKNIDLEFFDSPLLMEEVVKQYQLADIITLISTLEGFGMPIVEGNSIGRVVITANVTSMPEVAADSAHLVNPFSIESMKNGFIKIINDEEYRNKLIESGYENCKRFSNIKIAEQFAEVYEIIRDELLIGRSSNFVKPYITESQDQFIESYSNIKKWQSTTIRDSARKIALDAIGLFDDFKNAKAFTKNRIQFLYIHHIFKDEEKKFRELIEFLLRYHSFIGYSEAVTKILTNDIDKPYICFSSDDGFKNNLLGAKILEDYRIKACFFICPGIIENNNYIDIKNFCANRLELPPVEFLNWKDIDDLLNQGHEIGSHTLTHRDLTSITTDKLCDEVQLSYDIIKQKCGSIRHFAYPYGRYFHINETVRKIIFDTGYQSCNSAERGCHIQQIQPAVKENLLIRRDHILLTWKLNHIKYFLRRNSLNPSLQKNNFPFSSYESAHFN